MASKTRKMKLVAYHASFTDHTKITFENVLDQLKKKLPQHKDRVFHTESAADPSLVISKFLTHPSNSGTSAVFSIYHKDAEISTISFEKSDEDLEFNTHLASDGEEYLDKNILLFAVDDTVIACGLGNRRSYVCSAIYHLAVNSGVLPHTTSFNFADIPRGDVLETINRVGVKQIDFDATALLGSLPHSFQSGILATVFGSSDSGEALKRRRENTVNLTVKNSSLWGKSHISNSEHDRNKWLDSVAGKVVEDVNVPSRMIT